LTAFYVHETTEVIYKSRTQSDWWYRLQTTRSIQLSNLLYCLYLLLMAVGLLSWIKDF